MGHATRCKYCGFISKYGGIARLKAHLGGVDLKTQLESCPNVPPEVKSLMAKEVKRYMKKSKGIPMVLQGKTLAKSKLFICPSNLDFRQYYVVSNKTYYACVWNFLLKRISSLPHWFTICGFCSQRLREQAAKCCHLKTGITSSEKLWMGSRIQV